jgi:hypothetical protein
MWSGCQWLRMEDLAGMAMKTLDSIKGGVFLDQPTKYELCEFHARWQNSLDMVYKLYYRVLHPVAFSLYIFLNIIKG